jgi:hypothetical protein
MCAIYQVALVAIEALPHVTKETPSNHGASL